jgi:hypothetical protein
MSIDPEFRWVWWFYVSRDTKVYHNTVGWDNRMLGGHNGKLVFLYRRFVFFAEQSSMVCRFSRSNPFSLGH